MFAKFQQRAHDDEGFTLVELLVVIAILGILAGIVVFSVSGVGNKGQTAACSTEKSILQTAQEAYFAGATAGSSGKYAVDATALQTAKLLNSPPSWYTTAGIGSPPTTYTVTVTTAGTTAGCS